MVFLTGLIFQQRHAHLDQQSKIFQQGCILIPLAGVGNNLPWVVDRRVGDVPRNARQTDKLCRENKRLFYYFPWAVLGLLFALTVFIVYLKFLFHLPQRFAFLFITSGALYVGGAVGMEFIAARIIDGFGVASIYHTIVQTIEESLEMIGAILFFYSLTEYWNNRYGGMEISSPKQS